MVPVKKVGKTFYEFLLIKQQTKLSLDQRKQISAETVQALKGPELMACKQALEAPRTQDEWKDLWSGKRPDKTFQLQDCISNTESHFSPSEDGSGPDDSNPAHVFLKSLKEGPEKSPQGGQAEKTLTKQEQKQAKEQKKEEQKKIKEAKAKEADEKWQRKLEEATQVAEDKREFKVKKMLQMVSKTVADLKKACNKAADADWGKEELDKLQLLRSQLEDMQVDTHLPNVKRILVQCAQHLKAAKALLQSK